VTTVFIIAGTAVALIVAAALILPCEACRLRRERMTRAYAEWQARQRRS
jgi:hypothetical protein